MQEGRELCVREGLKGKKRNVHLSSDETKANIFRSIFVKWSGIKRTLHSIPQIWFEITISPWRKKKKEVQELIET